jgi:hypothetical protein
MIRMVKRCEKHQQRQEFKYGGSITFDQWRS